MEMQDMANVVEDINSLIAKYGLSVVKHALNYIDTFPVVSKQYRFKNTGIGSDWFLSEDEFKRVTTAYDNGRGKIQAIKIFRDITSCGLKEAKDAVENYYGIKPTIW